MVKTGREENNMEILDVDERLMYYNEELKEYKEEV
jgi:hypothetical protein